MLFLVYLAFPVIEIYLLIQAGRVFGFFPVLGLVIFSAWLGSRLVKSQGLLVFAQFQQRMQMGQLPRKEAIEGMMILFSGILLIAPGFITDFIGLLCLIPPTRKFLAIFVERWVEENIQRGKIKIFSVGGVKRPTAEPHIRDVTPENNETRHLD